MNRDSNQRRVKRPGAMPLMQLGIALVVVVGWQTQSRASDDAPRTERVTIKPDQSIQTALTELAAATTEDELDRQLSRVVKLGRPQCAPLVAQLLYYGERNANPTQARVIVARVLKRLDAPKDDVVATLILHLDNENAAIRKWTKDLLVGYEDRSASRPPDFSAYRAVIEADVRAGKEPRESLVKLMYESDPGAALTNMIRGVGLRKPEEIKPLLWAEHIVADLLWKRQFGFVAPRAVDAAAVDQIAKVARDNRWWVRLYAAAILVDNPELGNASLIESLSRDGNTLVRDALERAQKSKGTAQPSR